MSNIPILQVQQIIDLPFKGNANKLSQVIRAHEAKQNKGFEFNASGKVINRSRYCGGTNQAAVVFVDDDKIRVILVDTQYKLCNFAAN